MNRTSSILIGALTLVSLVSCNWKDDPNYKELMPITITVPSDTINTNAGERLILNNLVIESNLETTCEWVYGCPKKGTSIQDHDFEKIIKISENPNIDYTFDKIGTYILRLKVDNGESIQLKFFTLNVNAGYDEGVLVLCNSEEGKSNLSFIKTLTKEEEMTQQERFFTDIFHSLNPNYTLEKAQDIYMGDFPAKLGHLSKLVIATNDEKGRIYQMDAKTMELLTVTPMQEQYGTYCTELGGLHAKSNEGGNFILGADKQPYRYDMVLGFIAAFSDEKLELEHTYEGLFDKYGKPNKTAFWWGPNYVASRYSATKGIQLTKEEGWEVFNVACKRISNGNSDNPIYILFQNKQDKSSFKVKITTDNFRIFKNGINFTNADLKMDRNSKIINTRHSNDVYYAYDNAIYRWGLISTPALEPAIRLPKGELIRDISTNFKGMEKDAGGEDLLYIATYNPNRTSEHKGSLYIYQFSDNSLVEKFEGKFDDPVKVIYKYRTK